MSRVLGGQATKWATSLWSGANAGAPYAGTWVTPAAGLYANLLTAKTDYASRVLASTPAAYWRLDEPNTSATVADATGNGRTGTVINNVVLGGAGALVADPDTSAAFFSAFTQYITVADAAALRPNLLDYSIVLWVKRNGAPGASEYLLNKGTATVDGYEVFVDTAGKINSRIGALTLTSTVSVCDNAWHHVVISMKRNGGGVLYLDGVANQFISISSEVARNLNSAAALEIGRRSTGNYLNGSLDEVAVYIGDALTATQAMEQYQAASPGVPLIPNGSLRFAVQIHDPSMNASGAWGTAHWTTDVWQASVGGWQEITELVRGLSWGQGSTSPGSLPEVGTSTITLANMDGAVSPWATSGIWVRNGLSLFRTGRLVRFGTVSGTTFNPYFTGRIETLDEDTSENTDGWLTINLAELPAELAIYAPEYAIADGKALSAALLQLLEHADWPYQDSLEAPEDDAKLMEATVGGFQDSAYVKSIMEQLAASRWWAILSDGVGRVRVVPRHRAQSNSGLSFSNAPTGGELPLADVKPYANTDRLLNEASASRLNGSLITVTNAASVKQFGTITDRYEFPRDDFLLQSDADLTTLLQEVTQFYGFDDIALDSVTLDLDMSPSALVTVMDTLAQQGLNGYGFNVRWKHPSGSQLFGYYIAIGASWALTMQGSQAKWTCQLSLETAL